MCQVCIRKVGGYSTGQVYNVIIHKRHWGCSYTPVFIVTPYDPPIKMCQET